MLALTSACVWVRACVCVAGCVRAWVCCTIAVQDQDIFVRNCRKFYLVDLVEVLDHVAHQHALLLSAHILAGVSNFG